MNVNDFENNHRDRETENLDLDRIVQLLGAPIKAIRQAAFQKLSKLREDTAKEFLWNYLPYNRMECLHTFSDLIGITDCGYGNSPNELLDLPQYFGIADYSGQLVCYWCLTYKRAYLNCWNLTTGEVQKSCQLSTHEFGL